MSKDWGKNKLKNDAQRRLSESAGRFFTDLIAYVVIVAAESINNKSKRKRR